MKCCGHSWKCLRSELQLSLAGDFPVAPSLFRLIPMSKIQCDDPVFLNTRREALIILAVWGTCLAWVIPYCALYGYQLPLPGEEVPLVWGMPAWVFWGVAAPWLVASVVSFGLCLGVFQDDDLGTAPEEVAFPETGAET